MTCIAAALWLLPKPNVWIVVDHSPAPVRMNDGGTRAS
jgi:hypothetical protein